MKTAKFTCVAAIILCVSMSLFAQSPVSSMQSPTGSGAGLQQSPLLGAIPSGAPTPGVLPLSLKDAIERALKYNLGIALGQQNIQAARSARLRALSNLLPRVSVQATESEQQINLAALGFSGFPGIPQIIGPFPVFDVRALFSQSLLNLSDLESLRSGNENLNAAQHAYKNTRDLVVLACLQLYLQAVTGNSRIEANQVQLKTAQTLHELAVNRKSAGFIAGIDVLRAQVRMQAQQQRLIVSQNDFAKQKLTLAQAIGLPLGQEFQLTDTLPYAELTGVTVQDAVQEAYRNRGDYQSALALVKAAEDDRKAAGRQRTPTVNLNADYGDIGQHPTSSHGTFSVALSLRVPVFTGRETEARIMAADTQLEKEKAVSESLRAQIYYDIQSALLDLKSADDRVKVARSNLDLANQQVMQAQDRFAAGVESNIEVVQAQDALATASDDYIASLYAHNLAKVTLAQAMGVSESGYEKFLRGK